VWLRLTATGSRFQAVARCLAYYRLHGPSYSSNPDRMRAGCLRTLENFFARDDIPADVRALHSWALARVLIQSSARFFSANRQPEALHDFGEAGRCFPAVLNDDETYYSIICAEQPIAAKGTGEQLDLAVGEHRIFVALAAVDTITKHLYKRAQGMASFTLGRLAYAQNAPSKARRYFVRAIRDDGSLLFTTNLPTWLVRAILPSRWIAVLRNLHSLSAQSRGGTSQPSSPPYVRPTEDSP
jgi:hypothetical protein